MQIVEKSKKHLKLEFDNNQNSKHWIQINNKLPKCEYFLAYVLLCDSKSLGCGQDFHRFWQFVDQTANRLLMWSWFGLFL